MIIWIIQILSAIITGILLPNSTDADFSVQNTSEINMHLQMKNTLSAVASICGWVILFKVILSYMDIWVMPSLPKLTQCLLAGFLELANGLCMLSLIESDALRLIAATAMLSFGGMCVYFQTKSLAPELVDKHYILCKILQSLIAIGLAMIAGYFLYGLERPLLTASPLLITAAVVLIVVLYFNKKMVAFSR